MDPGMAQIRRRENDISRVCVSGDGLHPMVLLDLVWRSDGAKQAFTTNQGRDVDYPNRFY
jgi:hypothetical protein